jgi:hypothetical protein
MAKVVYTIPTTNEALREIHTNVAIQVYEEFLTI